MLLDMQLFKPTIKIHRREGEHFPVPSYNAELTNRSWQNNLKQDFNTALVAERVKNLLVKSCWQKADRRAENEPKMEPLVAAEAM